MRHELTLTGSLQAAFSEVVEAPGDVGAVDPDTVGLSGFGESET